MSERASKSRVLETALQGCEELLLAEDWEKLEKLAKAAFRWFELQPRRTVTDDDLEDFQRLGQILALCIQKTGGRKEEGLLWIERATTIGLSNLWLPGDLP